MRRNGFTMVELIFVIIIIGILSVAAIPKFGDIKDRAKSATEYGALAALDTGIEAALEFQRDDFNNIAVRWHNQDTNVDATDATVGYLGNNGINKNKTVLSKLLKNTDDLEIIKYIMMDETAAATTNKGMEYDILFIKGAASDATNGVKEADATNSLNGKPDKTDFWVFNTSGVSVTINHYDVDSNLPTEVKSGELKLIDGLDTFSAMGTDGADTTAKGEVSAELTDGTGLAIAG